MAIKSVAAGPVKEGSLHKWFSGSKSKDGKGGWVNVKTGGTCASDEPGEGTPKCVSSSKRASMSKAERESASRRKKAADPNQQSKSGAAKPTYVSTDKKKVKKESIENQITESDKKGKGSGTKDACYHKVKSRYSVWPSAYASGALVKCRKVGAANWGNSKKEGYEYADEGLVDGVKNIFNNLKNKIKQNSDARKKYNQTNPGGNITKSQYQNQVNTGTTNTNVMDSVEPKSYDDFMEACWKGYEKKGMKTMFGKRYPNCVKKTKKEEVEIEEGRMSSSNDMQSKMYADKNKSGKKMSDDEIKKEKGGSDFLARIKAAKEKMKKEETQNEGSSYGIYKGDGKPKGAMANFGDDKKKKKPKTYEEFQQECWKTHKKVGMKMKGGKLVPDCRPKNEEVEILDEKKSPAWQRKAGKSESGGLNAKGVASYRAANPGSKLKTAVTTKPSKLKKGSKSANRRKSFCARMTGMKKRLTSAKTARDPDSRINKALRKWNC